MLRKALMVAAALGATMAAAAAVIVALAYALFALLQTPLGSAGASACVAGAAAVLIGLAALIAARSGGAKRKKPVPAASGNLLQTLIDLFKDKPFVASGAAAAAAALTLIKPEIIGVILRSVLNARAPASPEKRRPKG